MSNHNDHHRPGRFCGMSAALLRSLFVALVLLAGVQAIVAAPDTLVLCPAIFRASLEPWITHRVQGGHQLKLIEPASSAADLRRQVRDAAAAAAGNLQYVVIIGDAPEKTSHRLDRIHAPVADNSGARPPAIRAWAVPTAFVPARVNVLWGSEPEIASDSPLADLDDDGLPDLAIGRLPVRSAAELRLVVDKILRYERAAGHDPWRRQVNIVAGLGGFGRIADAALESTTRTLLTQGVPAGYHTHLTYASWQSPYCPPPSKFRDSTIEGLNRGCLFWVYLGHGRPTILDHVYVPGGSFPIFETADVAQLDPAAASAIAVLVACHSGAFDGSEACLAEAMTTAANGPVATLAGSRVTLPYGNAVLCSELMRECFTIQRDTLGEMLLNAKRKAAAERPDDPHRGAIDLLARLLSPVASDLVSERREHTLLYNLLGDPLLRIAHAEPARIEVPEEATAGGTLTVSGVSTISGECLLELVTERGRLPFSPTPREHYDPSEAAIAEYAATYRRANERRYAAVELAVEPGPFTAKLTIPNEARGSCYVRAFIAGTGRHALGAAKVAVLPPAN